MKRRREALAPPLSQHSWRPTIRLRLSRLTGVREALVCRLINFSQSAAAPPLSRAGERSSNPMQRFSHQFSNVSASRRGLSWQFGERQRQVSEVRAVTRTSFRQSRILADDCRRTAYFTDQLYAALTLVERGIFSAGTRGSMHGEVGHTQFLPKNILNDGIGGSFDIAANALSSTANFLKAHGWRAGAAYQPGEANFAALQAWNAGSRLSAGYCGYWPTDRRRRGHLGGALRRTAVRGGRHYMRHDDHSPDRHGEDRGRAFDPLRRRRRPARRGRPPRGVCRSRSRCCGLNPLRDDAAEQRRYRCGHYSKDRTGLRQREHREEDNAAAPGRYPRGQDELAAVLDLGSKLFDPLRLQHRGASRLAIDGQNLLFPATLGAIAGGIGTPLNTRDSTRRN